MRQTRLATVLAAAGAVAGAAIISVATIGSAEAATLSSNWYGSAPYVMPLDNNPPDLAAVMAATGQKAFELAFVLAPNGGGCTPTWDGTAAVSSDTTVANTADHPLSTAPAPPAVAGMTSNGQCTR